MIGDDEPFDVLVVGAGPAGIGVGVTLPTVLLFSMILAVYKATGLVDRMNWALQYRRAVDRERRC